MNACIITIGDELLQGFTVDTNSTWISQQLQKVGIDVTTKVTVADGMDEIISTVKYKLDANHNFIFITGGLGPTHDDVTKTALNKLFNSEEVFDEKWYDILTERFAHRGLKIPDSNKSQATILKCSDSIENSLGTALGMRILQNQTQIFILPGVPQEMKSMMTETVIPEYLPNRINPQIITLQTIGITESQLFEDIQDIVEQNSDNYKFAFYPHHTGVNIRLKAINEESDLYKIKEVLGERLGNLIYGQDDESLSEIVGEMLANDGLTIATAESCTGGLLGKLLTDIPGSSEYFLGGVIAYSNDLKQNLVGVSFKTLETYGAVSKEVAIEMANGIRKKTSADIGIGTTGISGPTGGTEEKPVGLVHIAVSMNDITIVKEYHFLKDREMHREMTAYTALNLLRKQLIFNSNPT
ncbi:MAG: competence/damage-inducible protein A [Candidatus Marinimicrobia bacterium]|nr:competence/damage-inducible protein A [Candidatus Neomarinimicrobiota bacterium]MBL7023628.1 competence/damage-inducible protein A [Candidatus Neomarinimicrobiota bacterium]MBL7109815.1 competence/damage-inducible protein A [Candidatus Neomarinimicrobiota bacterium]